jgi:serine/threonine-protein kinase
MISRHRQASIAQAALAVASGMPALLLKGCAMETRTNDARVIAANLTAAVHLHILSMQLRGERVTTDEALEAVFTTYNQLLASSQRFGMAEFAELVEARRETTLAPRPAGSPLTDSAEIGATDFTAQPSLPRTETGGTVLTEAQPTPPSEPMPGAILDHRYRILQALGAGGMGKVYLGEQLSTGRTVALKVLPARAPEDLTVALNFFRQEATALAKLNHPNIAQIYDASVAGHHIFIVMEFVDGELLRDRLTRESRLPISEAVRIIREACVGLEAAHRAGIIHRDIKPENMMLVGGEGEYVRVKLLDFGLAILDDKDAMDNITGAGALAGTPAYMSPAQVSGLEVTPATDVYSLGVVAYEMLTGVNPFRGMSVYQTLQNHLQLAPPPIRQYNPQVPVELEGIVMRALEKEPDRRFADGGAWRRVF